MTPRSTLALTPTSIHAPTLASMRDRALADLDAWYDGGERLPYDPATRSLGNRAAPYNVFLRREGDQRHAITFLPGFPDGSSGWAKVLPSLPDATAMPKLVVEYLGMGDSDTPSSGYRYSTAERTDLVEAVWRHSGTTSTTIVAFDFSSLVVLEHLRRRIERDARGESEPGPDIRGVVLFNGGLFTDGHSHPWWTTPLLRQPGGWMGPLFGSVSFPLFMLMGGVMWSRGFAGRREAGHRIRESLARRDGRSYLNRGAGFVAEHRALGQRLDFGELFRAYRSRIPFLVGGSKLDPFEHRQVDLTKQRLAALGCEIARLPGGHMTTDEHPAALADLISSFIRRHALTSSSELSS